MDGAVHAEVIRSVCDIRAGILRLPSLSTHTHTHSHTHTHTHTPSEVLSALSKHATEKTILPASLFFSAVDTSHQKYDVSVSPAGKS